MGMRSKERAGGGPGKGGRRERGKDGEKDEQRKRKEFSLLSTSMSFNTSGNIINIWCLLKINVTFLKSSYT